MVDETTQALLGIMVAVIMLGMGASLTPRDFYLALKRPYGLLIGLFCQFGFMPFLGFLFVSILVVPDPIVIGILLMACMPGGTTSNIFTYFSKGNLSLSLLMTVTSTVTGIVLIPVILLLYASTLDIEIPAREFIPTLVVLIVPVLLGMGLRKLNANIGAVMEFTGSILGVLFIILIAATWVPANWQFLLDTQAAIYIAAIGLGIIGISLGYAFARLIRLHPRNARTVALETGIQNGPLAIAIIVFTFPPDQQQAIMAVPALYSLFIVIVSTGVTLFFRRANTAAEQKLPDSLL
ncbi:bile acid:sodium symporter family protein [Gymnodinialimonas hymeniacidonis]|uniref:bile acid:sodium symporter family protein n=1 Tax=Gymnodinialimonas hymeniacidonis TaxID=3126508 RepID=UPI0034C655AB